MRAPFCRHYYRGFGPGRHGGWPGDGAGQESRFGQWKMKQDPPALNITTYEPCRQGRHEDYGRGDQRRGAQDQVDLHDTMFDGKDEPVSGDTRTEFTAVKKIDAHTNEISNKRGGKVFQVVTNVLSADGNTINNTYKNYNEKGEPTTTTTAVYERIK